MSVIQGGRESGLIQQAEDSAEYQLFDQALNLDVIDAEVTEVPGELIPSYIVTFLLYSEPDSRTELNMSIEHNQLSGYNVVSSRLTVDRYQENEIVESLLYVIYEGRVTLLSGSEMTN